MANTAFHAYASSNLNNVTGDYTVYTIPWDSVRFDANSDINTSNGIFTAPVTGLYRISATITLINLGTNHVLGSLLLNTSGSGSYVLSYCNPFGKAEKLTGDNRLYIGGTVLVSMSENDTAYISIEVDNGTKVVDIIGGNFSNFCGEFVQ